MEAFGVKMNVIPIKMQMLQLSNAEYMYVECTTEYHQNKNRSNTQLLYRTICNLAQSMYHIPGSTNLNAPYGTQHHLKIENKHNHLEYIASFQNPIEVDRFRAAFP